MRKQVAISEATSEDLGREANKHGVSRDKVISKMLDFFRIYGIDPFNYDAPADEMQKIIKRFDQMFAFLKKQEKDIIIPTLTRVATMEEIKDFRVVSKSNLEYAVETINERTSNALESLQEENRALRSQLEELRAQDQNEHQNIADIVTSNVSKMLQEVTKTMGMRGQKTEVTLAELERYEH